MKDGFARNFLLPRSKALRAHSANMKVFEGRRVEIEAGNAKAREAASKAGEKLDGSSYVMIRQAGESGHLYGSVAGRDVADAVNAEGGKIERAMVVLDKPIKNLGVHEVKVRLHPEVTITVSINIARSADEAERQAKGETVITSQFEEDERAQARAGSRGRPVRRRPANEGPRPRPRRRLRPRSHFTRSVAPDGPQGSIRGRTDRLNSEFAGRPRRFCDSERFGRAATAWIPPPRHAKAKLSTGARFCCGAAD